MGIVVPVCITRDQVEPRLAYLRQVLDEVDKQRRELRVESRLFPIVIVNDESCLEVSRHIFEYAKWPRTKLSSLGRQRGTVPAEGARPWRLASAKNRGIEKLREYYWEELSGVLFLDPDCFPSPGYLAKMSKLASRGIVFGRTDSQTSSGEISEDPRLPAYHSSGFFPAAALYERGGGGNMSVATTILDKIGSFDTDFDGGFGYEETEFVVRSHNALGLPAYYSGDAAVLHLYHRRDGAHFKELDRNRSLFMKKTGLSAFSRSC